MNTSSTKKLIFIAALLSTSLVSIAQKRNDHHRPDGGQRPPRPDDNNDGTIPEEDGGRDRTRPPRPDDGGEPRPPRPDDGDDGDRPPQPDDGDDGRPDPDDGGADDPTQIGYFTGDRYRAMSAIDKLDDLWSMCESNRSVADQRWAEIPTLFRQDMRDSFQGGRDEMPRGRFKINHAQGVVAKVAWDDLGGHPYTGLYTGGSELGLLRMSEGNFLLPGDDEMPGLTPTLAIKFLRDGFDSVNLLANTSFEPINSFNFFAADFRSTIPSFRDECLQETIQAKFIEATREIGALGLSEFARRDTSGQPSNDPINFPFDLWFEPNQDLRGLWPETRQPDDPFFEQLQDIPNGSVLFRVMARDIPNDPRRFGRESRVQHIANIRATSDIITSLFGDERLFFQHERKRDDFDLRPEWRPYVEALDPRDEFGEQNIPFWPEHSQEEARAWVRGSLREHQCPFAWLLDEVINPLFEQN